MLTNIQKNAMNIAMGVCKIFFSIYLLNKAQLIANSANCITEPNGATTTTGQINNETTIKFLQIKFFLSLPLIY